MDKSSSELKSGCMVSSELYGDGVVIKKCICSNECIYLVNFISDNINRCISRSELVEC